MRGLFFDGCDDWGNSEQAHSFDLLEVGNSQKSLDRYSMAILSIEKTFPRNLRAHWDVVWPKKGLSILLGRLTDRAGPMPSSIELAVSLCREVFALTEGLHDFPSKDLICDLWRHSLRSGYLAACITEAQGEPSLSIWHAFAGGLLHDTGLLILLSQEAGRYLKVVKYACSQGMDLQTVEQEVFGTSHAQLGADLLSRWGLEETLVSVVSFHNEPFRWSRARFCPATAVYLADLLDGGGIAQDGDGIMSPEGEDYLLRLGLYDRLPFWQAYIRDIQKKTWI